MAPIRAVLQIMPSDFEAARPVAVTKGDRVDQHDLVERLVKMGYRREYQVEHVGEVAVRGGIIDVFPSTAELPVRIDMWGDEVDRLTTFDPGDQRSLEPLDQAVIFGCRELVPTESVRAREISRPRRALGPGPLGPARRRPVVRRDGILAPLAHR